MDEAKLDVQQEEVDKMKVALFLNLAACNLRISQWGYAANYSKKVYSINSFITSRVPAVRARI